jgi:hypothetical protein
LDRTLLAAARARIGRRDRFAPTFGRREIIRSVDVR